MLKILLILLLQTTVQAHPIDAAYLQIDLEGRGLRVQFDLHPKAAADIVPNSDQLFAATIGSTPLQSDAGPCTLSSPSLKPSEQSLSLTATGTCPTEATTLTWDLAFLHRFPARYQILGKLIWQGDERVFTVSAESPSLELKRKPESRFSNFIWMGIEHIGAAPSEWKDKAGHLQLPDGIDHILFLLALILGGGALGQMLVTVTGFTVGHSITLALALLGIVQLPVRLVESLVALSIAFVAVESFRPSISSSRRWKLAAFFGLIHGFGFAAALGDLHLTSRPQLAQALAGYNIGIEIGQASIVVILMPLVLWIKRSLLLSRYVVGTSAAGIGFTGAFWFLQRAFGF